MSITYHPKYKQMFPWSSEDGTDTGSALCTLCKSSFRIDTMGKSAFESHEKGKKHRLLLDVPKSNNAIKMYFAVKTSQNETKSTL